MTVEDLKNLRDCHAAVASLRSRIARIEDSLCSPSGAPMTHAPTAAGPADPVGDGVAQLVALQQALRERIAELERHIAAVEGEIDALPPRERAVIRARYVDGLGWREVAERTHYSVDHCKRIGRECVRNLRL